MNIIKIFRSLFVAIFVILSVEIFLYIITGKEKIKLSIAENNFFDNQFKKSDVPQKYLIKYKHKLFTGYKSEFIQIGDSSGLYSLRPNIVNNYLDGMKYINVSCCADIGWKGYAITGNYFLRRSPNVKYLVLYFTPYNLPTPFNQENEFTKDIKSIYEDNLDYDLFKIFNYLPSQTLRKKTLDFVFLKNTQTKSYEPKDLVEAMGLIRVFKKFTGFDPENLLDSLIFHKGWMPYPDTINVDKRYIYSGSCGVGISDRFFGKYKSGSLSNGIKMINNVAQNNKVKLVVIFNPVACKESETINPILKELNNLKKQNPNIIFLNDFINTIDKENFVDNEHLTPFASIQNSKFIGETIKSKIINKYKK